MYQGSPSDAILTAWKPFSDSERSKGTFDAASNSIASPAGRPDDTDCLSSPSARCRFARSNIPGTLSGSEPSKNTLPPASTNAFICRSVSRGMNRVVGTTKARYLVPDGATMSPPATRLPSNCLSET